MRSPAGDLPMPKNPNAEFPLFYRSIVWTHPVGATDKMLSFQEEDRMYSRWYSLSELKVRQNTFPGVSRYINNVSVKFYGPSRQLF